MATTAGCIHARCLDSQADERQARQHVRHQQQRYLAAWLRAEPPPSTCRWWQHRALEQSLLPIVQVHPQAILLVQPERVQVHLRHLSRARLHRGPVLARPRHVVPASSHPIRQGTTALRREGQRSTVFVAGNDMALHMYMSIDCFNVRK